MKKHCCILLLALSAVPLQYGHSQVLFSNGATVRINTGAVVQVNGGTEVTNGSAFVNNGTLTVTKNSTLPNPGNFMLNTGANVSGNGLYRVEQDWINDAVFTANNSKVDLFGNSQQFITSNTGVSTTFHNLALLGSGVGANRKKTLQNVNASNDASGVLEINDRELETQGNSFFVNNTSVAAVTNTTTPGSEGFVSSIAPGVFSRATNSTGTYVFPTGSSTGTLRYRPIEIVPNAAAANTYTVRLNNLDPTTDGFDRADNDGSMCVLNNLYYHSILRSSGTTPADIRMFYVNAADGAWGGIGHWRNASTNWNNMGTMSTGSSGVFSTLTRNAWGFVNPGDHYVLTNKRPEQPSINCPSICENSLANTFTLTGTATNYQWTVPANGNIASGQGTNSIDVDWTTGTGYVYVYAVGTAGCNSLPDSCLPAVLPVPVAYFSTDGNAGSFQDTYSFIDSSQNATSWLWEFGDGGTSSEQNPTYQYTGEGTYLVILTVTNSAGCSDTASMVLDASEGIVIPNVFSPNGDGLNDAFFITASGLKEYALSIFNRWGQQVYESTVPGEKWDGKYNGKPCEDGTYFFVLTAKTNKKDYSTHGTVTVTGSK